MTARPWWFYQSPEQAADRLEGYNRYEIMMAQGCNECREQKEAWGSKYCKLGKLPESNNFCRNFEVK